MTRLLVGANILPQTRCDLLSLHSFRTGTRRQEDDDGESVDPPSEEPNRWRRRATATYSAAKAVTPAVLGSQVDGRAGLAWIVRGVEPATAGAPVCPCLLGQVRIDAKQDDEETRIRENGRRQLGISLVIDTNKESSPLGPVTSTGPEGFFDGRRPPLRGAG